MLWLSISIVFVCVCGVAWVTFLLLAKRHTKLHPRETSSPGLAVPSPISQTQESTQPKPSIDQVSCQSGEPPPSSAPDLKETSHWVIKAVVEASGSSGEGSIPGAQEKEREVPVNQPVISIAETEIEETTPITPITADAEPQSSVKQVGETTEESIGQEESATNGVEPQRWKVPKLMSKKKRTKKPRLKPNAEDAEVDAHSGPEPKSIKDHEWLQDLDNEKAELEMRRPGPYRPPSQEPLAVPRRSAVGQTGRQTPQRILALSVRLLFAKSGYCRIGLLPQRIPDMPGEITLTDRERKFNVAAIQDEWYEDVFPEDLGEILGNGIRWKGEGDSNLLVYWQLSGRDLYVLAGKDLNGFVQTTRLKIGRKHVLLCRESLVSKVEQILRETRCKDFKTLPGSYGTPRGWTAIRDVIPTTFVKIEAVPEIFSILQPEPELEIDLEGGIHLQQSSWLAGFPPRICVSGALDSVVEVFVDGEKACIQEDDSFGTSGHDAIGDHIVSVPLGNVSKTYRICKASDDWEPWGAHNLGHVQLCGPLLLTSEADQPTCAVIVPSKNPVLLGPHPGEITWCPPVSGPKRAGFATFNPVWALPDDPYGSNKLSTYVLMIEPLTLVPEPRCRQFTGKKALRVSAWCAAIMNASRKGLRVEPENEDNISLWKEYKRYARTLRKKTKG
jgi:hypothetical protein